jgi:glycosyltransferase involved in cell wall biosynthesis
MQHEKKLKVSVCVVTYNQESYIRQCLQSIVDQKTDFDFEVIVGDDCSTDRTRIIAQEFVNKYPEIVKPRFKEKNIGAINNYLDVHRAAQGEYIAHIDGDDFALQGRLQKQADFLDDNMICSMVAHKMLITVNDRLVGVTKNNPNRFDMRYLLLKHPCFLNSSTMYRKTYDNEFLSCEKDLLDFYVYISLAKKGFIGFINEELGCYRGRVGISAGLRLMPLIQHAIDFASDYIMDDKVINIARARQYLSYAVASLRANDKIHFLENIVSARKCNKKNFLIFSIFYMRNLDWIIRFLIILFKSSRVKIFRIKRNLLFGRDK